MRTRHADRFWLLGGVLAGVLMLAVGWFMLVGPQYTEAGTLSAGVEASEVQLIKLRRDLAELKKQNDELARYETQLEQHRAALPADSGIPAFVAELESTGDRTSVQVTALTVGAPTPVTDVNTLIYRLPLTLNATGDAANLDRFLKALQQGQARAVLIRSADASDDASVAGSVSLALTMEAFMAPAPNPGPAPAAPAGN